VLNSFLRCKLVCKITNKLYGIKVSKFEFRGVILIEALQSVQTIWHRSLSNRKPSIYWEDENILVQVRTGTFNARKL
jgi:hypothetical protein